VLAFGVPSIPKHRRVLGDNLRNHRKARRFTQEKLAEKTGLSVIFLSLLENGRRTASFDSLVKIAKALNIGLEDLVRGIR
jgi:transcriptional regulator with XRE-family HTH domain